MGLHILTIIKYWQRKHASNFQGTLLAKNWYHLSQTRVLFRSIMLGRLHFLNPIIIPPRCDYQSCHLVGGPTKAKFWLKLETSWNQQLRAIGLHLKSELLTLTLPNHIAYEVGFNLVVKLWPIIGDHHYHMSLPISSKPPFRQNQKLEINGI